MCRGVCTCFKYPGVFAHALRYRIFCVFTYICMLGSISHSLSSSSSRPSLREVCTAAQPHCKNYALQVQVIMNVHAPGLQHPKPFTHVIASRLNHHKFTTRSAHACRHCTHTWVSKWQRHALLKAKITCNQVHVSHSPSSRASEFSASLSLHSQQ